MATTDTPQLARRLIWFAILWAGGVAAVAALAFVLRLFLFPDALRPLAWFSLQRASMRL